MATKYRESFGAMPFSDTGTGINLAANTELTYTVPGTSNDQYVCQFAWAYNANVYVAINQTPVLPAAGALGAGYNQELRPVSKFVRGGDVLHFLSVSAAADNSLSLYSLPA